MKVGDLYMDFNGVTLKIVRIFIDGHIAQFVKLVTDTGQNITLLTSRFKEDIRMGYFTHINTTPSVETCYPFIARIPKASKHPCSCDSHSLFNFGCKCGGL